MIKNNTKLFILLSVLLVVILGVFLFFIIRYSKIEKNVYDIEEGSVLYTDSLQYIKTSGKSKIKQAFNGNYYLYETNGVETVKNKLGKSVVVSTPNNSYIDLYGDAYQVLVNGEIVQFKKTNKVSKSSPTKLFKLDDRKYLMVDSNIVSKNDKVINTNGYLYIEIDKNGNASFANNNLSFKTINPITLSGSQFDFDIANETVTYDKKDISLKSIIGSSNKYVRKENMLITDNKVVNETESNTTKTNSSSGDTDPFVEMDIGYYDDYLNSIITSVNNLVVSLRNANDTSSKLISQKTVYYDFNKWVALKGVASTSSAINISYSVFDPNSEYDVVFVRLTDHDDNSKIYYLNKNNTSYSIGDLKPDTEYNLEFGYKANNTNKEKIEDEVVVSTCKAAYDLKVTKISTKNIISSSSMQITIYYDLKVDLNYKFKTAKLTFTSNGNELATETLSNDSSANTATVISSDQIGENGIYHGKLVLEENVLFDSSGAENILSLDEAVICRRDDTSSCSIDPSISINYKFYNE